MQDTTAEEKHLIIAGTTKAATTSLYFYLSDHPQICGSSIKETRYFLDPDYPLQSQSRYDGKTNTYSYYFKDCERAMVRMEATPDYMYGNQTPGWIKGCFGEQATILFLLREPISRIESWYNFAKQDGHIPETETIEQYVKSMLSQKNLANLPQYMRALEQGRYASYIQNWSAHFAPEQIKIVFMEDIKQNPQEVLQKIAQEIGINADFYQDYEVEVKNKTVQMKNPKLHQAYKQFRFKVRNYTHNKPVIHKRLQWLRKSFEPLYLKLNQSGQDAQTLSDETKAQLLDYYRHELLRLAEFVDLPSEWQALYQIPGNA